MKKILILPLLLLSLSSLSQVVTFGNVPNWVKQVDLPANAGADLLKNEISGGFYSSLVDNQWNVETKTDYYHYITNVASYAGITGASQLSISYDSTYQHVVFHYLYIWRKGVKIDRTADLTFELLKQENSLVAGVYHGRCTAYELLNDVRKDDLIEYAFSVVGSNPIFGESVHWVQILENYDPIDRMTYRILYSKDKEYKSICTNCTGLTFTELTEGNYKVVEVRGDSIRPTKPEDNTPQWITPFPYLQISSFNNWSEVNRWAMDVFALKKKPDLSPVLSEVLTGNETQEAKIDKLIDFVQDEIRYMGVETGIGNIKPTDPEEVIRLRYGDCKGKSQLLVHLLKEIGIETVWPVLLNTSLKKEFHDQLPGNGLFNHCIVKFDYNDSTYWVDPTSFLQGGNFRTLYTPDYGKVLVVGQPSDSLVEMNPRKGISEMEFITIFDSPSFRQPVTVTAIAIRRGGEADGERVNFETIPASQLTENLLKEFRDLYPTIEQAGESEFIDDPVNNVFKSIHHFTIKRFWDDNDSIPGRTPGYYTFVHRPADVYQLVNFGQCVERKTEMMLAYPFNLKEKFIFNCPADFFFLDKFTHHETDAYTFDKSIVQLNSRTVQTEYTFKTKSDCLTPAQFLTVCNKKSEITSDLRFALIFPKTDIIR